MESSEKKIILSSFMWKFLERISSQGVSFVIGIILARLLLPSDYGVVALVQVLVAIASVFVTSGFSAALIQNKNADDLDFSTILYCSLAASILLYVVLFLTAPFIADFYNVPELTLITRVYAFVLVLYGYNSVQSAWVSRNMVFKKFFIATLLGTFVSGIVGLLMAYNGFGAWSIVGQSMTNVVVNMFVIRLIIPWRPKLIFSFSRAKKLMNYGTKILGADLIGTIFNEIQQILIGRIYTPADLAFFNKGRGLPYLVTNNIDNSINAVLFPALSNHSDDPVVMKQMVRKGIKLSSYIMFFFMATLAIFAKPFIELLLTAKWLECVPYMQFICISSMIGIMSTANLQALKASGNGGTVLKLEVVKKPVYLIMIAVAAGISVRAIAMTFPIYAVYSALINMIPNKRILNYSLTEQLKDVAPASILTMVMAALVYPLNGMDMPCLPKVFLMGIACAAVYFLFSWVFKVEAFLLCKTMIFNRLKMRDA